MSSRIGVTSFTDNLSGEQCIAFARSIEALGYDSLWLPELMGREPFTTAAYLLANTGRLRVATGIANIYLRDAETAAQSRHGLQEFSGGRFILGLGVSHPPMAEARGHSWLPPVQKTREYLQRIAAMQVMAPAPATPAPVLLAAHGPKLLAVAAELADGAKTYLVPPEHTVSARAGLGSKQLLVVLPCCLDTDLERAKRAVRKGLAIYLPLPAYRRLWSAQGFADADFSAGGSDRLIERVCAFGDADQIRARIDQYYGAGASQVLISPLHGDLERPGASMTRLQMLERMAH